MPRRHQPQREKENPCPLCGKRIKARDRINLLRKTKQLRTAEHLKKGTRPLGARRVCYKCWFMQTTESMTKEDIAAAIILLKKDGIYIEMKEGAGRNFEERLERTLEYLKSDEELEDE